MKYLKKQSSLFGMLLCLTFLFIVAQLALFFVHYKVSELIDSLANNTISHEIFQPFILLPVVQFIVIQILAYVLFVSFIWFVSVSLGEFFKLSKVYSYWLGILFWLLGCILILSLNHFYFSHSFFANLLSDYAFLRNKSFTILLACLFGFSTVIAYIHLLLTRRHFILGCLFFILVLSGGAIAIHDHAMAGYARHRIEKPNIIIIGLDSLRPDFTSYFGHITKTPYIDQFLQTGSIFTESYTPLARTFPAWISILTGKYPKHHNARINLADPTPVLTNDSLVKHLKANGYETLFGTDEMRFSDMTEQYGFDRIIGPQPGAVEFILAGLSDFPLTNLLTKLPGARFLLPYSFGNRAADITYDPDQFLQLVSLALSERTNKPLFLALHLCLTHWPFTWAGDNQAQELIASLRYQQSVQAIDQQFGKLMQLLKAAGLLEHSFVVLLSDHGVTLGMPHDRLLDEKNYRGNKKKLKWVTRFKLNTAEEYSFDFKHDFTLSTSYGQGTDVLSPNQYHVLLSFKGFGIPLPARKISTITSLMDIAPTILDLLRLPPLQDIDGISLKPYFASDSTKKPLQPFFLETGDTIGELETDNIHTEKVVQETIKVYQLNLGGMLTLNPTYEKKMLNNKQRAVLYGDWMLAHYPARNRLKLVKDTDGKTLTLKPKQVPPYFVLVNIKTHLWTVDLNSSFAKNAPIKDLMYRLKTFYGNEIGSYSNLR